MTWFTFDFGKTDKLPTNYELKKTWVTIDITEVIIYFSFVTFVVIYLIILPGFERAKRVHIGIKVFLSVFIGFSLLLGNFDQEWEVGEVVSSIPYRAGEKSEIQAKIGIKIGLRSVNVTLKGEGKIGTQLETETINYNERFSWEWDQGIFGFGPNSGRLQQELRASQRRGLPISIIYIIDYFLIDGENIRFGRFYRTAGWYCHLLLWTAVPAWILANIFLHSVGRYAAYFTGIVGILQIVTCIVWVYVRNPNPLIIQFEKGAIETFYGSSFWLTLFTGLLCLFLAFVLIILELRYPNLLAIFLGIDILNQFDEFLVRTNELSQTVDKSKNCESLEMGKVNEQLSSPDSAVMLLKRRTLNKRAQKDLIRSSHQPVKIHTYDNDEPEYANQYLPGTSNNDIVMSIRPPIPRKKRK